MVSSSPDAGQALVETGAEISPSSGCSNNGAPDPRRPRRDPLCFVRNSARASPLRAALPRLDVVPFSRRSVIHQRRETSATQFLQPVAPTPPTCLIGSAASGRNLHHDSAARCTIEHLSIAGDCESIRDEMHGVLLSVGARRVAARMPPRAIGRRSPREGPGAAGTSTKMIEHAAISHCR
jgi:hypothetical protein